MKIRKIIENDIVEDISTYKDIFNSFIEFIREVEPDYEPSFTFNEFCVKFLNNFKGVDDELSSYSEEIPLTDNLMNSIMDIALEEFKDDEEKCEKIKNIIKDIQ